jgi:UbiD family decarboxylase
LNRVSIEREDGFGYQPLTEFAEYFSTSWPSLENILSELKTVLTNADFVIEGYVDPTEPLRDEGPFGDHTGYYTLPEPYPVFHVTAITHRKDAVYPATIVGIPPMEDFYIGGASVKLFLPIFKMNFPEIVYSSSSK